MALSGQCPQRRHRYGKLSDLSTEALIVSDDRAFKTLEAYLASVPAVQQSFGHGHDASGGWWVKFSIDIEHPLAWHVVQELGHVLNYL